MRKFIVRDERYFARLGVAPYIALELVGSSWVEDGLVSTVMDTGDQILTATECEEAYPGILDAWRAGDDSAEARAEELHDLNEAAEKAAITSSARAWDAELAKTQDLIERAGPSFAGMSAERTMEFEYGPRPAGK